jgi:importin-4
LTLNEIVGVSCFELRGCVTDTLGTIAGAVGKEEFLPYMDRSFQLAFEGMNLETPLLRESAFCFFAVLAAVLKGELSPVLPQIVPAIIESLKQDDLDLGESMSEHRARELANADIDILDTDDEDDESLELNINSAVQLEKEVAADALGEIFVNVKESFLPFLETATEQLVELVDTFYDGGRKAALSALWKFVITLGELQVTEPWQPGLPVV